MNLSKLFEMQKVLDERIIGEKGLEGQDLLPNTILALQVELGELANEWRGFKHWSNDREPRREKMLVEYVDCLHFILSIGGKLIHNHAVQILPYNTPGYNFEMDSLTDQFLCLFSEMSDLWNFGEIDEPYSVFLTRFIRLGEMLGFTRDEIEQAYIDKNRVNHERQATGY